MAFSQFASRLKSWKTKADRKPKPTLNLSQKALSQFSQETVSLTHTSISSLIQEKFGVITPQVFRDTCQGISPRLLLPNTDIIPELLNLVAAVIAVNIKRNHTAGGERIEYENDFLVCIEVFADALHSQPVDLPARVALERKIAWGEITCDVLGVELDSNEQLQQFQALCTKFGLSDHELLRIEPKTEGAYRDANRLLLKLPMTKALYLAGVVYFAATNSDSASNCYGGLLFLISFSFTRTENFQTANWNRRSQEVTRTLLNNNQLLTSLAESSARELSRLLLQKVQDGLDPAAFKDEITRVVEGGYKAVPQLQALAGQATFKGMTSLQVISRAIAERTEVPWSLLLSKFPVLGSELNTATEFIKLVQGDPFAGMKYGGISREIRNLQYFCTKILIILGGEETLKRYAGYGGDSSTQAVPLKLQLDVWIEKLKEAQAKKAQDINVGEQSEDLESFESQMKIITDYFNVPDLPGGEDDSDDDDDDQPPAGPSGVTESFQPSIPPYTQDDDPDEVMSSISTTSGTKRPAPLHDPTESTPSKRSGPFPTPGKGLDVLTSLETGEIEFEGFLAILESLRVVEPPSSLQRSSKEFMTLQIGSDIIQVRELTESSVNVGKSGEEYVKGIIQIMEAFLLVIPSRRKSPQLRIPCEIINNMITLNPTLLLYKVSQLCTAWMVFLVALGARGTIGWDSTHLVDEADARLLPLITTQLNQTGAPAFFKDLARSIPAFKRGETISLRYEDELKEIEQSPPE